MTKFLHNVLVPFLLIPTIIMLLLLVLIIWINTVILIPLFVLSGKSWKDAFVFWIKENTTLVGKIADAFI